MKRQIPLILLLLFLVTLTCSCKHAEKVTTDVKEANFIDLGSLALKEEKYPEAIDKFTQALEKDPKSFPALLGRAEAYNQVGSFANAFKDSIAALEVKAGDMHAIQQKALSLEGQGKIEEAKKIYDHLCKTQPTSGEVYFLRGNFFAKCMNFDKALADYKRSLKYDPDHSETYLNRGIVHQKLGKFKPAIDDYTQAIKYKTEKDENSPLSYAYYNRGGAHYRAGDLKSAQQDWEKAHELAPSSVEGKLAETCLKQYCKNEE